MKQQFLFILRKDILVTFQGFFQNMKKTVLLQVFQKANIFKKMQLFLAKRNTDHKLLMMIFYHAFNYQKC